MKEFNKITLVFEVKGIKEANIDTVKELNKYGITNPKQRDICIAHHFFELGLKAKI